jgi:23S rRNA (adenine2503-C2)-methyltransferase
MMQRVMENLTPKINILGLSQAELAVMVAELGLKSFITKQILEWLYEKKVSDFEQMSNISKANQQLLAQKFETTWYKNLLILPSSDQLAIKYVFELMDGAKIECVVLKERTYTTLCVSSQAGCPVDCKFCLTGVVGFKRNLEAHEIVGQIFKTMQDGHNISHLVFMGMGEPLLNYDRVFKSIDILQAEYSFNISKRKMTVSTSGYLQGIKRLIADKRFINLAFSVGNANASKRAQLMPIEKRNPLMEVTKALSTYQKMHNRKLTLEYTLLEGKNDQIEDIRDLCSLAKYLKAKINLINLNPHPKIPFKPVTTKHLHLVKYWIESANVPVTVRFKKGQDISAACGQLGESYL